MQSSLTPILGCLNDCLSLFLPGGSQIGAHQTRGLFVRLKTSQRSSQIMLSCSSSQEGIASLTNYSGLRSIGSSYIKISRESFSKLSLDDSAAGSMRMTLNSIAPLKKKIIKQRRLAPWFSPKSCRLK